MLFLHLYSSQLSYPQHLTTLYCEYNYTIAVDLPHDIITNIPCTNSVAIMDCDLALVVLHWIVMLLDTLVITSVGIVPLVVIVILLFMGGSCSGTPLINHCRPSVPIRETHNNVAVDP